MEKGGGRQYRPLASFSLWSHDFFNANRHSQVLQLYRLWKC
jgi:hypothetical protein